MTMLIVSFEVFAMLLLKCFAVFIYKDKEGELILYNEVVNPEMSIPNLESKNISIVSDAMSRHIYENEMRSIRSSQVYLLIDRGTNK
jgi:hypothetical protein